MPESGATRYLRKDGWLKVYRTRGRLRRDRAGARSRRRIRPAVRGARPRRRARARAGAGAAVRQCACTGPSAASVTNPLAVTRAYVARFTALGGVMLTGDARTLHRANDRWRVETDEGPVDAREAVVALGPWAPDVLEADGHRPAARRQARLSPALPSARQCRADAGRWSTPRSAIASRRWSRGSASPPARNSPTATRRRRRCSSTG